MLVFAALNLHGFRVEVQFIFAGAWSRCGMTMLKSSSFIIRVSSVFQALAKQRPSKRLFGTTGDTCNILIKVSFHS